MAKASNPKRKAFTRNIAQVPWKQFPDHFGGALSKPLVMPETAGSLHIDYRISCYQPMAHVARHKHQIQEQIYHVLDGEGLMEIGDEPASCANTMSSSYHPGSSIQSQTAALPISYSSSPPRRRRTNR